MFLLVLSTAMYDTFKEMRKLVKRKHESIKHYDLNSTDGNKLDSISIKEYLDR